MFSRIRVAFGIALLVTLITSMTALAKGNFAFVSLTGPKLKGAVRSTDPALTDDFFAFADFSQGEVTAPADPGPGYEVTRYYINVHSEIAFDHLHYYPETGFVYYDGIVNGWSEYDGKWYAAKPEIRVAFENALPADAQSVAPVAQSELARFLAQNRAIVGIVAITGLAFLLLFASRFRKPATR